MLEAGLATIAVEMEYCHRLLVVVAVSIGIPLAVSADVSFIVPSASMTVHPVRTNGLVLVPQTTVYFERSGAHHQVHHRPQPHPTGDAGTAMMNTQEMATDMGTGDLRQRL